MAHTVYKQNHLYNENKDGLSCI